MKNLYLLLVIPLMLLAAGCKKNYVDNTTNSSASKTDGKGSTSVTASSGRLVAFKINGANCAYDSTAHVFYYPVSLGAPMSGYTVSFDTTQAQAIYIDNTKLTNGATSNVALTTNQQLEVRSVNELNTGFTYSLIITGMPIVTLTASKEIGDDRMKATFDIVDPAHVARGGKLEVSSNIMISLRGATSRYLPKRSYAVHIVDDGGNDQDVSLLGLRNDNSWILDAMYIDQSRMRNRLATDMWNSFNNVPYLASEPTALNGTRGYMTEVFLNNQYQGIYCLTEKLDRKQLQIKKQYGDMYKADNWTNETDFTGISTFSNSSDTWGGWELEYPDLGDTPAPDWGYLYTAVNYFATAGDEDFTANIANKADINNMVDYFIFVNMIRGTDNQTKNYFFSFYDYRTAGKFFFSPWDMDGTMGGNVAGYHADNLILGAGNNNLLQRLLDLNVGNFKGLVKARWAALKADQLSKATVAGRIEGYRSIMVNTNAFAREKIAWKDNIYTDLTEEATFMKGWYADQFDAFDKYVNGL